MSEHPTPSPVSGQRQLSGNAVRRLPDIACATCQKVFRPLEATTKYCSRACLAKANSERPHSKKSPESRFWAKVDKTSSPHGCWLWTAALNVGGYGYFGVAAGDMRTAHRFSWELVNGPVPTDLCVLHNCDQYYAIGDITYRRCCNVAHLWLGTHADNNADMMAKGRGPVGDKNGSRKHPECLLRGEKNPIAKLTVADVLEIRQRVASGESQASIARDKGVGQMTICNIARGKIWKHVPMPDGPVTRPVRTHCKWGHLLNEKRKCRTCQREYEKRHSQRKKAKLFRRTYDRLGNAGGRAAP